MSSARPNALKNCVEHGLNMSQLGWIRTFGQRLALVVAIGFTLPAHAVDTAATASAEVPSEIPAEVAPPASTPVPTSAPAQTQTQTTAQTTTQATTTAPVITTHPLNMAW